MATQYLVQVITHWLESIVEHTNMFESVWAEVPNIALLATDFGN